MRGFTLLELLVVISIIGLLTVVVVPSYNDYNKSLKLAEATAGLQSVLRQAQNNAQTGTVCKIGTNSYKASSWVVTLNSTSYSVSPVCVGAPPTPTPVPQQYFLPSGIEITAVTAKNGSTSCSVNPSTNPTIEYKNLSSEVAFNLLGCLSGVNTSVEIVINFLTGYSNARSVVVDKSGSIYVNSVNIYINKKL